MSILQYIAVYFIRKVGSSQNLKNIDAILNLLHNKVYIALELNRMYTYIYMFI